MTEVERSGEDWQARCQRCSWSGPLEDAAEAVGRANGHAETVHGATGDEWSLVSFKVPLLGGHVDGALRLTGRQRDGEACVYCGGADASMDLVGYGPDGQLFAHRRCVEPRKERHV